jgi:hypothetical protein
MARTFGLGELIAAVALLLALPYPALALSSYVDLIPNGAVNGCDNCHIGGGGGPATDFQPDFVNNGYAWDQSLADQDSDGDGFANGYELLDPTGTWQAGEPDPGDPADVTLPGTGSSYSPTGVRIDVPTTALSPGTSFWANLILDNADADKSNVPLFFVLAVGGQYWFWPSWSYFNGSSGIDYEIVPSVPHGGSLITGLPSFTWPDTGGATGTFTFYGAMLTPDLSAVDGALDSVTVTFGP